MAHGLVQRKADRVRQASTGEEVDEVVGAAGRIGADQDLATRTAGQAGYLCQRSAGGADVIGGGVRSDIAWSQQDRSVRTGVQTDDAPPGEACDK